VMLLIFLFSSRRRHTRSIRDWSSDVCSSDLKKRASIAVELLADPKLFFLDEPTSGLDPGTEKSLMLSLKTLAQQHGKTIIMVTRSEERRVGKEKRNREWTNK